eukprot:COSAG04_NODE_9896_length_823_cov_0.563536_1_plen_65_part_00
MLKGVVPKEMTAEARRRIFEPTDEEREKGAGSLGSAPEITDLINKSRDLLARLPQAMLLEKSPH